MTRKFDIKGRLKEYFPIFFELLGENNLDWKTIEKRFIYKLEEHENKCVLTGQPSIRIEASLFHIITASREKDDDAIQLLDFITKLFQELCDRLTNEEKRLIKKNLFDLLTNIDMNYLNFLGELCVLNQIKRNTKLKLIATELPLTNHKEGTKSDFVFADELDKRILVEIVNIRIDDKSTETDEKIERLLDQKIQGKLNKKGRQTTNDFFLIPVIWGPVINIRKLIAYYKTNEPKFKNTTIPACFMTFIDDLGNRVHRFGTIDTILK